MGYSLAVDGGGTKLYLLLFDEDMHCRGRSTGSGTNTNFTSAAQVKENMRRSLEECLGGQDVGPIDRLYLSIVGPNDVMEALVRERCGLRQTVMLGEGGAALLAGGLWDCGMVAIAGTGATMYYRSEQGRFRTLGGWGSLLGDWGSGFYIGQRGCQACVRMEEGWGEKTLIRELLMEQYGITRLWEMVPLVYQSPSYQRAVAECAKVVSKAAAMGDAVALSIYRDAGELIAQQIDATIRRYNITGRAKRVVANGGAWKGSPVMFESFARWLHERHPDMPVQRPVFDPVMAGIVQSCLDAGRLDDAMIARLRSEYSDYVWKE